MNLVGTTRRRQLILLALAILGWRACALAAPSTLTTLRAVTELNFADAERKLPVAIEATVTYYEPESGTAFLQDGDDGVYAFCAKPFSIALGDRVLVRGTTGRSFRTFVFAEDVTLLRHGQRPVPAASTFSSLISGQRDSRLVTLRATVRSADPWSNNSATLQLVTDGGHLQALVTFNDLAALNSLLDADVEITGVEGGQFDDKKEQTGVILFVASLDDIRVLHRSPSNTLALPITPIDHILAVFHAHDLTPRVRVRGTITYFSPGTAAVIQNGAMSLWISTHTLVPVRIGDLVDVTGFPEPREHHLVLTDAEITDTQIAAPIQPFHGTWQDLSSSTGDARDGHRDDLVSLDGVVVKAIREASQDDYFLASDGHIFTAILRQPVGRSAPPMREIAPGTTIRVTGICNELDGNSSLTITQQAPFNVLLRSYDDIAILARPPWINVRNLLIVAGLLLLLLFVAGIRSLALERNVRRESTVAAYVEQRRALILEKINKSCPLDEILVDITDMVSYRLHGAACWCEIAEGERLGKKPQKITLQRIIEQKMRGHTGIALGRIFAAINGQRKPGPEEAVALSQGASLAVLAIETSRLHSDLVHRSEFDLLTDVPNRFSLEKKLDELVREAQEKSATFGFIFIDFDHFKQVNDQFGHQAGDTFLQQSVLRMKHQLRPGDSLARLGGDEFAAVVLEVSNRADVEEVALRLERCFIDPFSIDGHVIHGSASIGIALYPEEADSADSLLSKADAAMYAVKQKRKGVSR